MNAYKLIAIALAALLVTAGAAIATPGESPTNDGTETADEHRPDEAGDDATDVDEEASAGDENETDVNDTDAEDARDENASAGPPTEMPEQVPDHVSTIHQLIRDKLNGDLGNTTLGEAISGVVDSDEQADSADEQSADGSDEQSTEAQENNESDTANAGLAGELPEQAADHVSAIHDAITSFLNGDGDNPGDEVSQAGA